MIKQILMAFVVAAVATAGLFQTTGARAEMSNGEVTKIDTSANKISIRHGPIKNLDMDAMHMVFHVKDAAMLTQVKVGDKINFEADRVNGQLTVTKIQKAR